MKKNYFIKNYNEESDKGCFLEVDVQYLEKIHNLDSDLPFLPQRMNTEKFERFVANSHNKTKFYIYNSSAIHIINLKQALNDGLVLKKN